MGQVNIGPRIHVDGEEEYRKKIMDIIQQSRTLDSELKAISSSFDKNATAQEKSAATMETLTKRIKVQQERVALLEEMTKKSVDATKKSADATDETSRKTLRWQEAVNNAKAELNRLNAQLAETTEAVEAEQAAEQKAAEHGDAFAKATDKSSKSLSAKAVVIGNIIADLARRGVALVKEIGQIGLDYDKEMERSTKSLANSLGSVEAAAQAIANIKRDAVNAPLYSVSDLVKANQMLISTGESAEDARKTIMGLSEAISATGGGNAELERMASNLQQIKNAGKATAMDIRQFAYAGIDIYGILSDYTGKAVEDVQDLEVSYSLLSKAFYAAAQEGGRYFGANAAQAATLNGQLNSLRNTVKAKLGEAFQGIADMLRDDLLPAANDFISSLDTEKAVGYIEDLTVAAVAAGGAIYAMAKIKEVQALAADFKKAGIALSGLSKAEQIVALNAGLMNEKVSVANIVAAALTGQVEKATVKTMALNTALAALPAALFVGGIAAIAVAVKEGIEASNEYAESLASQGETIDEVRENLEKLQQQRAAMMEEDKNGVWTDNARISYLTLNKAIAETESRLEEMEAAEREAAAAEAEHAAYLETTAGKCEQLSLSIQDLMTAYQETYSSAYESLTGQFGLFEQAGDIAALSTEEILNAMQSQADYFNSYADNLNQLERLTADSIGLNAQLVSQINDGSEQSVIYAASLVQGYQAALAQGDDAAAAYIRNVNAAFDNQQQAMRNAAESIAKSKTDIETSLQEMVTAAQQAAADMDQYEEMRISATESIQGYIDGLRASENALYQSMSNIASNAMAAFRSGPRINTEAIRANQRVMVNGSHAAGLDYVPFDGYIAQLHKGEMVLNAALASEFRNGGSTHNYGGVTVQVYGAEGQDINALADEIMYRIQDATERRGAVYG